MQQKTSFINLRKHSHLLRQVVLSTPSSLSTHQTFADIWHMYWQTVKGSHPKLNGNYHNHQHYFLPPSFVRPKKKHEEQPCRILVHHFVDWIWDGNVVATLNVTRRKTSWIGWTIDGRAESYRLSKAPTRSETTTVPVCASPLWRHLNYHCELAR